ncbi:MAG: hypothetical protein Fur0043_05030 [Anaerolineales bacterium]
MLKALQSVSPFQNVDERTLSLFAELFEPFSCPEGTVIFEQGERANFIYLLLSGKIEIRYKPYDGPPITVTNLSKGHFFGWSAVIGNPTYTSGAVCKKDCIAIRMRNIDLYDFCVREPEAGCLILDLLAQSVSNRWKNAHDQIHSLLNSRLATNNCRIKPVKEER